MLELQLTQGALFFEVTEHLEDDETFDIRTSNMVVGIRGTSGYVYYDDAGRESLVITDGTVHVTATNPDTGELRETTVSGGCQIKVYLYSDRAEDTVEFVLEELSENELPGFVLTMLSQDPELLDRVCGETSWDPQLIMSLASGDEEPVSETEESTETTIEITPSPVPVTPEESAPEATVTPVPVPEPDGTEEGYEPSDIWFEGIYIETNGELYRGYTIDGWVDLELSEEDYGDGIKQTYIIVDTGEVFYEYSVA